MSNCFSCKKKFALLNIDRRRCKECEQYFCYNCMPTIFGTYCKICKILNTRPPMLNAIIKLRAREIKIYLAKRKIQTESCIEKEDLVKCFIKYVSIESQLKNKRSYAAFITQQTNRYSSTPNLLGAPRERNESAVPQTPPPRMPYASEENASGSSQQEPAHRSQDTNEEEQMSSPESETTRTNTSAFEDQPVQETAGSPKSEENSFTGPMKLSNIQEAKDIQMLSIKQLKELLILNRVDYKGCVEKDELRSKVTQLWNASKEKPDVTNLPVDELCKICMDAPLNSVLLECGHIVSCIDCGKQLAECPICRQYVVRVVHTFKA